MRRGMGPLPNKVAKEAKGHRSKGARRQAQPTDGDTSATCTPRPWQKGKSLLRPMLDARLRSYTDRL